MGNISNYMTHTHTFTGEIKAMTINRGGEASFKYQECDHEGCKIRQMIKEKLKGQEFYSWRYPAPIKEEREKKNS